MKKNNYTEQNRKVMQDLKRHHIIGDAALKYAECLIGLAKTSDTKEIEKIYAKAHKLKNKYFQVLVEQKFAPAPIATSDTEDFTKAPIKNEKIEVLAVTPKIEKISEPEIISKKVSEPETITLTKKIKCDSNQQQLYFEL